jgi:hypothetical protein
MGFSMVFSLDWVSLFLVVRFRCGFLESPADRHGARGGRGTVIGTYVLSKPFDCHNFGRMELKAMNAVLEKAVSSHPNSENLTPRIYMENFSEKEAILIDDLEWILHGLERLHGEKEH